MKIKVAGVQMTCAEELEKNLKKAVKLGRMAADSGARVICYQPLFNTLWFPRSIDDKNFKLAEGENGPTLERMRKEASKLKVCFILPLFEKEGEDYYYTAFVIGKDGEIMGKYRKIHIPDIPLWKEKHYFSEGNKGYTVFEFDDLRFGVQICWDIFFPEGSRILSLQGASVIFVPTAAAFLSYHKWETVIVASAIVNGVYMMRVNRIGSEAEQDFYGRSFCADPEGDFIIGPIGLNDGVVLADLDTEKINSVREQWSFISDRRQETYGPLIGRA